MASCKNFMVFYILKQKNYFVNERKEDVGFLSEKKFGKQGIHSVTETTNSDTKCGIID